jgi:hypothetical protein
MNNPLVKLYMDRQQELTALRAKIKAREDYLNPPPLTDAQIDAIMRSLDIQAMIEQCVIDVPSKSEATTAVSNRLRNHLKTFWL